MSLIGVDLGGTKVCAALIDGQEVLKKETMKISGHGDEMTVVNEIISVISKVFSNDAEGIGIGVPSLVNVEKGIVYEVQNIPSWKEVHLKKLIEEKFHKTVYVNNDANCFAVGEKYYGKAIGYDNVAGITLGTGMGTGLIVNGKLYSGKHCGAGEFGLVPYLDHDLEYYCSGHFFKNLTDADGIDIYKRALQNDQEALNHYKEFGKHVGNAIKVVMYSVDPEIIVLGGSITAAYDYFIQGVWDSVNTFAYTHVLPSLKIEKSENPDMAVLGAAALYLDGKN